jgi:hypothetical protein
MSKQWSVRGTVGGLLGQTLIKNKSTGEYKRVSVSNPRDRERIGKKISEGKTRPNKGW